MAASHIARAASAAAKAGDALRDQISTPPDAAAQTGSCCSGARGCSGSADWTAPVVAPVEPHCVSPRSTSAAEHDGRSSLRYPVQLPDTRLRHRRCNRRNLAVCALNAMRRARRARGWYLIPPHPLTLEFPENREVNREFAKIGNPSDERAGPLAANIGVFERSSASWHQGIRVHRTGNGSQVSGAAHVWL